MSKYRTYLWIALGAVSLCVFCVVLQNLLSGEEGRVRRFVMQAKRAVESRSALACADMLSKDYHDRYGNDRQSALYILKEVFDYYTRISVQIIHIEIALDESKTRSGVEIEALVIGQNRQNNLEKILEGEHGRLKARLVKEKKKWLLVEIEFLEPITAMGQTVAWSAQGSTHS